MPRPWPHDTHEKLSEQGYKFRHFAMCMGGSCKERLLWYETPNRRMMPFNRKADGTTLEPHFASCPDRVSFRAVGGAPVRKAVPTVPDEKGRG